MLLKPFFDIDGDEIAAQGLTWQLSVCWQLRVVGSYAQFS